MLTFFDIRYHPKCLQIGAKLSYHKGCFYSMLHLGLVSVDFDLIKNERNI